MHKGDAGLSYGHGSMSMVTGGKEGQSKCRGKHAEVPFWLFLFLSQAGRKRKNVTD